MVTRLNANIDYNWLIEAQPYDPAVPGQVSVYLATRPTFFNANDPDAPNRVYRGCVTQALTSTRSMFGGNALIGGNSLATYGAVVLTIGDEFAVQRAYYKTLRWAGWNVRVLRGVVDSTYADYEVMFDGYFGSDPDFEKTRIPIQLGDLQTKLAQPFQSAVYGGTGGTDGGADVAGQYRPDGVGINRGVTGKWIDQNNGVVDVCASGFDTVLKVTDGANDVPSNPTSPPGAGKYYADMANGRIQFGSQPTFGFRIDFISAFASAATTLGTITEAILTRAGFSGGQLDGAAFADLDSDRPEDTGWYCADGDTYQQLLDALIGGVIGFYTSTPDGKMTVGLVEPPTATSKTDSSVDLVITDRDIVPDSLKRSTGGAPPRTINVKARKNWTVLDASRIAGAAAADDKAFAMSEFRTIAKTNATTVAEYPQSVSLDIETPFDDLAEASDVGDEWLFLTEQQPTAEVTIVHPPFALRLGAQVWIESEINEVNAPAIVAEIEDDAGDNQVRMRLYGLAEAA